MRCLVTGATGFVGSWLLKRLVDDGHSVAALIRPDSNVWRIESLLEEMTVITGDLSTIESLDTQIGAFAPDTIFHLAWTGGNSSRFNLDPAQVLANLPGTLKLFEIAARCGTSCFVNLGSCVEYGDFNVPVRETDHVLPKNLYGAAKYAVELLGEQLAQSWGFRFASMRLFWSYGPGDDEARLVPSIFQKLSAGQRLAMTPGDQLWDFVYIEDVVDALVRVAVNPEAQGSFNLGSGRSVPLKEVATAISDLLGRRDLLGIGDIPYPPGQTMHLLADISRLHCATGWVPTVSLEDGLRRTAEWYRSGRHSGRATLHGPGPVAG